MVKCQVTAIGQCVSIVQGLPGTGEVAITCQADLGEKIHVQMSEQMAALLKEKLDGLRLPPSGLSPVKGLQ